MNIKIEEVDGKSDWLVRLDTCAVSFKSEEEAKAFAERLHARLEAPHPLPDSCHEVIAELS